MSRDVEVLRAALKGWEDPMDWTTPPAGVLPIEWHAALTAAVSALEERSEIAKLRGVATEALESARFLDGIRRRSMGTAAVADRLLGVLRDAGFEP